MASFRVKKDVVSIFLMVFITNLSATILPSLPFTVIQLNSQGLTLVIQTATHSKPRL